VQTGNVLKTKMMPQVVLLPIGKILRTHAYFGIRWVIYEKGFIE